LRLVTSRREPENQEIRFRFPAGEEIWEVSCESEHDLDETPERGLVAVRLRARSRRAS
jgi:hypothetical protein